MMSHDGTAISMVTPRLFGINVGRSSTVQQLHGAVQSVQSPLQTGQSPEYGPQALPGDGSLSTTHYSGGRLP